MSGFIRNGKKKTFYDKVSICSFFDYFEYLFGFSEYFYAANEQISCINNLG